MLIQKIKKICKAEKKIVIVNRSDGSQWIGTNNALYPVLDIRLNRDSVAVLFDLGSDVEDYDIITVDAASLENSGMTLCDTEDGETELSTMKFDLSFYGIDCIPITDGEVALCMKPEHLDPLKEYSERTYWLRRCDHWYYIAVKNGYQIIAVIGAYKYPPYIIEDIKVLIQLAVQLRDGADAEQSMLLLSDQGEVGE